MSDRIEHLAPRREAHRLKHDSDNAYAMAEQAYKRLIELNLLKLSRDDLYTAVHVLYKLKVVMALSRPDVKEALGSAFNLETGELVPNHAVAIINEIVPASFAVRMT